MKKIIEQLLLKGMGVKIEPAGVRLKIVVSKGRNSKSKQIPYADLDNCTIDEKETVKSIVWCFDEVLKKLKP